MELDNPKQEVNQIENQDKQQLQETQLQKLRTIFQNSKEIKPLILDGAVGSLLFERFPDKYQTGQWMTKVNFDNLEDLINLHVDYINNGAQMISTNTFRTNPYSMKNEFQQSVKNAVYCGKEAIKRTRTGTILAGSNPPAEYCYQSERTVSQEILKYNHEEHIKALIENGCDLILNETQGHLDEIDMTCEFCETNKIPYIISLFTQDSKLLSGQPVEDIFNYILGKYNPLVISFNCISYRELFNNLKKIKNIEKTNWGCYINCGKEEFFDNWNLFTTDTEEQEKNANNSPFQQGLSPQDVVNFYKSNVYSLNPVLLGHCCCTNQEFTNVLEKDVQQNYKK